MQSSQPNRTMDEFAIAPDQADREWPQHEQLADLVNREALHLVEIAGSPDRAKQAIDAAYESPRNLAAKEELAHDLGYRSVRQMMEQTEIVPLPSGAYMHLTTDTDGYWVAWSDLPFYEIQRFETRQSALSALRESAESILSES